MVAVGVILICYVMHKKKQPAEENNSHDTGGENNISPLPSQTDESVLLSPSADPGERLASVLTGKSSKTSRAVRKAETQHNIE